MATHFSFFVSHKETKVKIGTLPSLNPCPMTTDIHALTIALCNKLATITSHQSYEYWYIGMVEQVYALMDSPPCQDCMDIQDNFNSTQQQDAEAIYVVTKNIWDSQSNVCWAIINALNKAVPQNTSWLVVTESECRYMRLMIAPARSS